MRSTPTVRSKVSSANVSPIERLVRVTLNGSQGMAPKPNVRGAKKKAKPPEVDCFAPLAMTTLPFPAYCCKDIKPADGSVPDNLRHPCRRRRVAAALGTDDAVDDGHADAGQIAELHAVQNVLAGRMLRHVHDHEIGGAADLDDAAVQRPHPRGVAGGEAEGDFGRQVAERRQ